MFFISFSAPTIRRSTDLAREQFYCFVLYCKQFTVRVHPVYLKGKGEGRGKKN